MTNKELITQCQNFVDDEPDETFTLQLLNTGIYSVPITPMHLQFSPDLKYVFILNPDGSITASPLFALSDAEKRELYEQVAAQGYA